MRLRPIGRLVIRYRPQVARSAGGSNPTPSNARITENSLVRVTETSQVRVTE